MYLIHRNTTSSIVGVAPTDSTVIDWCRTNCKKKVPLTAFRFNRNGTRTYRYDGEEHFLEVIANPDCWTFVLDDDAYCVQQVNFIG